MNYINTVGKLLSVVETLKTILYHSIRVLYCKYEQKNKCTGTLQKIQSSVGACSYKNRSPLWTKNKLKNEAADEFNRFPFIGFGVTESDIIRGWLDESY